MSEPPEFWALLASLVTVLGVFGRLLLKKGCFCASPCGPHVCIIDTKSNPDSMKAFAQHMTVSEEPV